MKGVRGVAAVVVCLSAAVAIASGPGRPFDDDDAGCVPDTIPHWRCSEKLTKAFANLIAAVTSCHDHQARAAFSGLPFDEEACEAKAQARFEVTRAAVAPLCSASQLAGAAAEEAALLDPTSPESLDAQNADVFCD